MGGEVGFIDPARCTRNSQSARMLVRLQPVFGVWSFWLELVITPLYLCAFNSTAMRLRRGVDNPGCIERGVTDLSNRPVPLCPVLDQNRFIFLGIYG